MARQYGTSESLTVRASGLKPNTARQSLTPSIAPPAGASPIRKASPATSSLAWLIARYRETTAWSDLSVATRKRRDNIFAGMTATAGAEPYSRITRATIEAGRERRAKTPHQARLAGSIKAEKNGVEVPMIVLPVLQRTLEAGPCGDLNFIVGGNGRPLTKESFGNEFRDACKKAGVPGSAHGVRKLAATRMANNGATEAQLMAVFGWTDPKMAAHYTRTANRKRLAAQSIEMLNGSGTPIPAPDPPMRAPEAKAK